MIVMEQTERLLTGPTRASRADLRARVELATEWLLRDGISFVDGPAQGAFSMGYDRRSGQVLPAYTEITGYSVSLLMALGAHTRLPRARERARKAAAYIGRVQVKSPDNPKADGGVVEQTAEGRNFSRLWAFDAAMCGAGLVGLLADEGWEENLAVATGLGDWLLNPMQREDGSFWAAYDLARRELVSDALFGHGSCIHAKHSLFLLRLAKARGDDRYADAALKACDYALQLQDDDGAFWAMPDRAQIFTHAHCYALEGLIYTHRVSGDERYLAAFRQGISWLLSAQLRSGGLQQTYRVRRGLARRVNNWLNPFTATDATAQAIRLWLIAYAMEEGSSYLAAAGRALDFLLSVQCLETSDARAKGGFYYGTTRGRPSRYMYTWCTQFAIAAMLAFSEASSGNASAAEMIDSLF